MKRKNFYWILDISPRSSGLFLFCIPPLSVFYFLIVGSYLLEKTNKKNILFEAATTVALILFLSIILVGPFVSEKLQAMPELTKIILTLTGIFSYFISIATLSYITVNYERLLKEERCYTFSDNLDYVKRFLCFGYFPFTIWSFQLLANEYRKEGSSVISPPKNLQ